jgi:hypothetical protein
MAFANDPLAVAIAVKRKHPTPMIPIEPLDRVV